MSIIIITIIIITIIIIIIIISIAIMMIKMLIMITMPRYDIVISSDVARTRTNGCIFFKLRDPTV